MRTTAGFVLLATLCVVSHAVARHGAVFPAPTYQPTGGNPGPGDAGWMPGPKSGAGPTPSGPSTPGLGGGSQPTGVPTGGRGPTPSVATQGALEATSWEFWWRYNRDAFLDLKARVDSLGPATLSDTLPATDATILRGIEASLAALSREYQRDLVSSLLVGVARSCDGAAAARGAEIAKRLSAFVANPDREVGETAALAIGILRHHAGLADLAGLLHDDEAGRKLAGGRVPSRTRAFAAYGLGIAAARSEREELRAFVAHHLERALENSRGEPAADLEAACVIALGLVPLPDAAGDGSIRSATKRNADEPRPRSRAGQAAMLLEVLLDEQRPATARAHVPDALARLGVGADAALRNEIARELAAVLERQGREDAGVVRGAVLALGRLADCRSGASDARMRAALKKSLETAETHARLFALVALAQVAARGATAEDAGAVQSEIESLLLERLARGKNRERAWASLALGVLEHGRVAGGQEPSAAVRLALRRALPEATAPDQVGAIAIGLGLCRDNAATEILLVKLEEVRDPIGRGHVATALGLLQAPEAVPQLRAMLTKSRFQPELLRETAIALALIGDPQLETQLLEELRQAKSLSSQAGLARAIGFCGTLATVDPLAKMLADGSLTAGARAFSAVALGMVCDRERLPWNAVLSFGVNYPSAPATLSDGSAGILDIL